MRSSSWCANYTPTIPATTVFSDSEVEVFLPVQMNESVQPKAASREGRLSLGVTAFSLRRCVRISAHAFVYIARLPACAPARSGVTCVTVIATVTSVTYVTSVTASTTVTYATSVTATATLPVPKGIRTTSAKLASHVWGVVGRWMKRRSSWWPLVARVVDKFRSAKEFVYVVTCSQRLFPFYRWTPQFTRKRQWATLAESWSWTGASRPVLPSRGAHPCGSCVSCQFWV
eukprot:1180844-Prorocentrum_minimum.AAC.1